MTYLKNIIIPVTICILTACTGLDSGRDKVIPAISFGNFRVNANKLTFDVTSEDAIAATYLVTNDEMMPENYPVREIFDDGEEIEANTKVTVTCNLDWDASYTVYIVAVSISKEFATDVRKVRISSETYMDLGAPANTYIVSEEGYYGFKTKKVDGSLINVVDADWLWATVEEPFAKEQKVISDVGLTYDEDGIGVVSFKTTGTEGNAVIVGFDEKGDVAWSWLIWCTDQPEAKRLNETTYFLDRAIGATAATREEGIKAWHNIMYQFGRLSPFFGGYEDEWDGQEFNEARKWTIVNPLLSADFHWNVDHGQKVSRKEADKQPMTFYTGVSNLKEGYWYSGVLDMDFLYSWYGLRQEDGSYLRTKTNLDPCPAGYMVPSASDWVGYDVNEGLNLSSSAGVVEWVNRWNKATDIFKSRLTPYGTSASPVGWEYTYEGEISWFPCGNANRQDSTGQLIRGYGGTTMLWNSSLYDYGPLKYAPAGIISNLFPSRWTFLMDTEATQSLDSGANMGFAIGIRCMKIKDTAK